MYAHDIGIVIIDEYMTFIGNGFLHQLCVASDFMQYLAPGLVSQVGCCHKTVFLTVFSNHFTLGPDFHLDSQKLGITFPEIGYFRFFRTDFQAQPFP